MAQADVDAGDKPGLTSDERRELAERRRDKRRLELENEILERAAAYFAQVQRGVAGRRQSGCVQRICGSSGWREAVLNASSARRSSATSRRRPASSSSYESECSPG
jgi:hypothetical protein